MSRITATISRRSAGYFLLAGLLCGALSLTQPPAWAADAEPGLTGRIAFIRDQNIWLVDLDKATEKQLTTSGDCSGPSWSPDGSKLVYARSQSWREGQLWILDVAAGTAARLTSKPSDYLFPQWSPDGEWIAVFAYDDGVQPTVDDNPSRLLKINLETKAVTILQKGIWAVKSLCWAPSGTALTYSYGTQGNAKLAGLLLEEEGAKPEVFRELGGQAGPEVTISGIRWTDPEAINFCEFAAAENCSLTIRTVGAGGKAAVVRDFGDIATAAIPLSNTSDGSGPWLLTNEEGLWLWQNGKKAKLYDNESSEPAWSPTPEAAD